MEGIQVQGEKLEQPRKNKKTNRVFGVLSCEEIRDGAYWVGLDLSDVQRGLLEYFQCIIMEDLNKMFAAAKDRGL